MLTILGLTDWLWFEHPNFTDQEIGWTKHEPTELITIKEVSNLFDIRRAIKARIDYAHVIRNLSVRECHNLMTAIDFFSTVAGTKYINGSFDRENYNYYVNIAFLDVFNEMIAAEKLEDFFFAISHRDYIEQCSQCDNLYNFCDNVMEEFLSWEYITKHSDKIFNSPARVAIEKEYEANRDSFVRSVKDIITAY